MEKIKGIVEQTGTDTAQIKGVATAKFWVKLKDDTRRFSGFGTCPWKEEEEIEFEYETQTLDSGATFFNIKSKKQFKSNFADIVKALTMPKVSVGYEKTIQVNQYEPKKVSCYITMSAEELNPEKIQSMIKIAKGEVEAEIKGVQEPAAKEPKEKPEETKKSEGDGLLNRAFDNAEKHEEDL